MPVSHEDQRRVPLPVAVALSRLDQLLDLGLREVFTYAFSGKSPSLFCTGSACPPRLPTRFRIGQDRVMQRKAKPNADSIRSVMLSVRLTPALKAKLEQMAAKDHRTISNLVQLILERACGAAERKR